MSERSITRLFGDAEYRFCITSKVVTELEAQTGAGIGALFRRMIAGEFRNADIIHTLRLGLIGGGTSPHDAARLVRTYVEDRPFAETYPLAVDVLDALYSGVPANTAHAKLRDDIAKAYEAA